MTGEPPKRVKGIEPSSLAWKAIALPLSYTRGGRDWGVQDSNLRRHSHQIYSLTPLTARETPLVVFGGLLLVRLRSRVGWRPG